MPDTDFQLTKEEAMRAVQPRAAPEQLAELHPVALTALLYLQEALRREQYEACGAYVATAREFGAPELEIHGVITEPRRSIKAQRAAHALGLH
ncbi:MAG: hypothetical protein HY594_01930 [Candidatus Omnitrophica bacterium]|nr:hypothetical protein [Candidatus Omnitrophota bacterium]